MQEANRSANLTSVLPMIRRSNPALTVLALLLVSCANDPQPHLLGGAKGAAEPKQGSQAQALDDEAQRLNKMMAVRAVNPSDDGTCGSPCAKGLVCYQGVCIDPSQPLEVTPAQLVFVLYNHCGLEITSSPSLGTGCPPVEFYLQPECVANHLLDIAGLRSSSFVVKASNGNNQYEIPMQSSATNAALAIQAADMAATTETFVLDKLSDIQSGSCSGAPTASIKALAALAPDAVRTYEQAIDAAIENTLAVSDSQLASSQSVSEAARRAVGAEQLSRSAAAHLLVGGDPGLFGSTAEALCTTPQLTPQARRAVLLFRKAALSPNDILDSSVSTSVLVGTVGPAATCTTPLTCPGTKPCGSVTDRLLEFYPEALSGTDPLTDVAGLKLQDFEDARAYLADEIRSFNRSRTAVLPAIQLTATASSCFPRFAGVATQPPDRPSAYWAALASYEDYAGTYFQGSATYGNYALFGLHPPPPESPPPPGTSLYSFGELVLQGNDPRYSSTSSVPPLDVGAPGLAQFLNVTFSTLRSLKTNVEASSLAPDKRDEILGAIMPLLVEASQRDYGYVRLHRNVGNAFDLRVYGLQDRAQNGGLRLVIGEDGLACAMDGSIEGATCDLTSNALTITDFSNATIDDVGGLQVVIPTSTWNASWGWSTLQNRLYLLEKVDGKFKPVSVIYMPNLATTASAWAPILPEVFDRVATVLAPDPQWCTHSRTNCAGWDFDDRVALEDELSSDSDPVESSWRHYVTLARQAADEADLLGDKVIDLTQDSILRDENQQLAQIQRAEPAIKDLQEICGIDVDPTELLRNLSSDGTKDFNALRFGDACGLDSNGNQLPACPTGKTCIGGRCGTTCDPANPCSSPDTCIGGSCVLDPLLAIQISILGANLNGKTPPIDPANAYRLLQCVGSGTTVDLATLGSQPLCVWRDAFNPNLICQPSQTAPGLPCPVPLSSVGDCTDSAWMPPNTPLTGVQVDQTLGVFDTSLSHTPQVQLDCGTIRKLRQDPGFRNGGGDLLATLNEIAASNAFHPARLSPLAANLGWEARYGGYSAITLGGATLYATGSSDEGTSQGWPCQSIVSGCSGDDLFCTTIQCSDPDQRAYMNDRMMRAALAAYETALPDTINGNPQTLKNFKFPVYYFDGGTMSPLAPTFLSDGENTTNLGTDQTPYRLSSASTFSNVSLFNYHNYHRGMSLFKSVTEVTSTTNVMNLPYREDLLQVAPNCIDLRKQEATADNKPAFALRKCEQPQDSMFDANPPGTEAWRVPNGAGFLSIPTFQSGTPQGQNAVTLADAQVWRFGIDAVDWELPGFSDFEALYGGLSQHAEVTVNGQKGSDRPGYFAKVLAGVSDPSNLDEVSKRGTKDATFGLPSPMLAIESSPPGDPVRVPLMAPYHRTAQALLDGLDLLCQVSVGVQPDCSGPAPVVHNVEEIALAKAYLECVANSIVRKGSFAVLSGVPQQVVDQIKQQGSSFGTYPALGGTFGEKTNNLLTAMRNLSTYLPTLAGVLQDVANDMETVQTQLSIATDTKRLAQDQATLQKDQIALQEKINSINRTASTIEKVMKTITGVVDLGKKLPGVTGLDGVIGVGTSLVNVVKGVIDGEESNSVVQQGSKQVQADVQAVSNDTQHLADLSVDLAINTFNGTVNQHLQYLFDNAKNVTTAIGDMHTALAAIESERAKGRRALYKAMVMDSDVMKAQFETTSFMRTRLSSARVRYEAAHINARRMAFLARRAIEQRLGEDLSQVSDNLPLVDAPSTWVDSTCVNTGVNLAKHAELRSDFAEAYIGDYVTKLENVVESYRIVKNFHEGDDTAVISLRDDIDNVRIECSQPVDNLLFQSGDLESQVWQTGGCPAPTPGQTTPVQCLGVERLSDSRRAPLSPFPETWPASGKTGGYRVTFGNPTPGGSCTAPNCFLGPDTRLFQSVDLQAGRYRLSWYARDLFHEGIGVATVVRPLVNGNLVPGASAAAAVCVPVNGVCAAPDLTNWTRYYQVFELKNAQTVEIAIHPDGKPQFDITALMLEDLSDHADFSLTADPLPYPKPYMNTGEQLESLLPVCEDTTGAKFRRDHWQRRCVKLCGDGIRSDCTSSTAQTECYWETTFSLSQRDIDDGRLLNLSGFARGNFNYRIADVGVNFVGTGTRDCSSSATPSTCFSAGFIPYSIEHLGPYLVRNYDGDDFDAKLFTGRIEHARGLAAERYLTNPLSSADKELITPYLRSELSGRPIDGTYVLRVWDEPGVSFDAIEDVQVILDYRYWTRFN